MRPWISTRDHPRPPLRSGPRGPPTSTLFPYTTLFRSVRVRLLVCVGRLAALDGSASGVARAHRSDRKSTRLNSSHVEISYAVVCLKKKNIDTRPSSTSTSIRYRGPYEGTRDS